MDPDRFFQLYGVLHKRLAEEREAREAAGTQLSKTKAALVDATAHVELFKERALNAEQALTEMGGVINETEQSKVQSKRERGEILARFRDMQEEMDDERAAHENCKVECYAKIGRLESEIDSLRLQLETYKEAEAEAAAERRCSESSPSTGNAVEELLARYFSLFPQSRSENEYQFCIQDTGESSPAFTMLLTLAYEDLTGSVKHTAFMIDTPKHLAELAVTHGVTESLCRYMRILQVVNAPLFGDVFDALQKQTELTRHTINYENQELVSARQSFLMALLKESNKNQRQL